MRIRAFIAAPLLGTLVFLVSILVIINFNSSENAAVAETISGAYHNRLVSLVEIYRSDMGSVFNIGLQRNIEYGLTSQCWFNFAPVNTEFNLDPNNAGISDYSSYDADGNGIITEKEEKRFLCDRASSLVKTVVCSKKADYLFGIATWAKLLAEQTSFEGVNLTAANTESFLHLIGYNDVALPENKDLCESLISGVEIDCKHYAESDKFQCCSSFDPNGNCQQVVQGCEGGGQFFVRVSVQNNDVFSKFPRVYASDSAGNRIRAGAIADVDYNAPVGYPLFKYIDAAIRMNKYLAYGANGVNDKSSNTGETGANRGIIEGSCAGGSEGCKLLTSPHFDQVQGSLEGGPFTTSQEAQEGYARVFLGQNGVLEKACQEANNQPGENTLRLEPRLRINSDTYARCSDIVGAPTTPEYITATGIISRSCTEANPSNYCAYINKFGGDSNMFVKFIDTDTSVQVDAEKPNEFCWLSVLSFEN